MTETESAAAIEALRVLLGGLEDRPDWADAIRVVAYWEDTEGVQSVFSTKKVDPARDRALIRQITKHAGSILITIDEEADDESV